MLEDENDEDFEVEELFEEFEPLVLVVELLFPPKNPLFLSAGGVELKLVADGVFVNEL